MKKYIIFLFIPLIAGLLGACSGSGEITDNKENKESLPEETLKQKAFEHFLDGSVAESNGDFAGAILEFNQALKYDTSSGIYYALAKNYMALNKLADGLRCAKLAVRLEPGETEYLDILADVYLLARQDDSAAVVIEQIISIDSSDVSSYYKLARIYEEAKPLKAIEVYEKLTKIIGSDWNVLIRVAELYEKLGYKEEATRSLEELLAIDPSNLALQKLVVDFYQRNSKFDEAQKMLDDIIESRPDDIEAREKKAQIYLQQNNWEAAAKQFKYILEQPDIPLEAKVGIGASYFNKSFSDSTALPIAKELFQSIDKDTSNWQVKLYLGAIALTEGDDSIATENFKYVTENAKWNVDSWIRVGGLYFDNRKYKEAEKIMAQAVEIFPLDFSVNLILGLSLAQQQKNIEAKPYLKKAVELNPADLNALSAYSFTLGQLGENEDAAEYIERALIIDPNNVNLLGQLGLIYNNLKYWAESDSAYEKALRLDPNNTLINNNYAYSLSERGLQLERALQMITITLQADSANASYLDTAGWIYFKLDDYGKAYYYIKKAIDVGGEDNAVLLEHLGDVLFMQGKKEQAVEFWQKALRLDSSNELLKQKVETGVI